MPRAVNLGGVEKLIGDLGKELAEQENGENTAHERDGKSRPVVDPLDGAYTAEPGDHEQIGNDVDHSRNHDSAEQDSKNDVTAGKFDASEGIGGQDAE